MKHSTRTGIIQLVAIIVFVGLAVIVSQLMRIKYEPATRSGGGERELFVEAETFTPGPFQIVFATNGTIAARTEVNLVPQVSGRVIEVAPEFYAGGRFTAGQVLFTVDPRDFDNEVQRLEAEVARTITALKLEEAEASASLAEWRQLNGDLAPPPLVAREPQAAEARAIAQAARAALANANLALERTQFRLPFNGRVLSSRIGPGQFVQAGQSYGAAFDLSALEVVASLEGQQLEWLLNSPQVDVTLTAEHLGQEFTLIGELQRGASSLSPTTRFATVRFGFREPPRDLLPGVFTRITVHGPKHEGVTRIPASALQQNGQLWIVQDDATLVAFQPATLYADDDWIAVTNLESAARIVTNRISGAVAGTRVKTASSDLPDRAE